MRIAPRLDEPPAAAASYATCGPSRMRDGRSIGDHVPALSRRFFASSCVLLLGAAGSGRLEAQDDAAASRPLEDLTLDEVLTQGARFRPKVPSQWFWHPDGRWCRTEEASDGERLVASPIAGGKAQILVASSNLSMLLSGLGAVQDARRLPPLSFGNDGRSLVFVAASKDPARAIRFRVKLEGWALEAVAEHPARAEAVVVSSSGRTAWVDERDVFVAAPGEKAHRVTDEGSPDLKHGLSAHREEFGIKDGLWWDPDGVRAAFYREDLSPIAPYPMADFSAVPATALPSRYPMAGRAGSNVTIGVHDARDGRTTWLDTHPEEDRWLTNVTFSPDGSALYVAVVNRAQNRMELKRYSSKTGVETATLFVETDEQWVEPEHGPLFVPGSPDRFLWRSPRDGFDHLYLYDDAGRLVRQVTQGPRDVADVVGFSLDAKTIYYLASDDDPKTMHLWAAPLAEGEPRQVTRGRGRRSGVKLSPDGRSALALREDAETPPRIEAIDLATGESAILYAAPDPLAGKKRPRERFFTVGGASGGVLHGHLMHPPDAETSGVKRPVLCYVYGGPHSQLVVDTWGAGADLWLRHLAASGYVVYRVDGRGTSNRGIEWQQVVHRRLGAAEIEDQLAALKYVKSLPFVDASRCAVFGWSYGGFMAASLLCRAPDAFKAGVAGAPVTDWALYETGYGERYMDTPEENPEGYSAADVACYAKDLQGRLLVVQGTNDDVVVPQNTMRLIDRFISEGVDVEFFPYPGHPHGVTGKAKVHLYKKITKFLNESVAAGP
jgi:dipeptidyl-peptidase 4